MLDIRAYRSERNGIQVEVNRKYRQENPPNATPGFKYTIQQLGSFLLKEGYTSELISLLDEDEEIQLNNWVAEAKFAEQLNEDVDTLETCEIRIPQKLLKAVTQLALETKRANLDFIPSQVMLEALLFQAKKAQEKITHITGSNPGILEAIGIHTGHPFPEDRQDRLELECRPLFKALLKLKQPLVKTCLELEASAKAYGKEKKIPPGQLKEWANEIPGRQVKEMKKWYMAIAIDVLLKHGINPIDLIPAEKVAEHWARQRVKQYSLSEAKEIFFDTFKINDTDRNLIIKMIEAVYQRNAG